MAKNTWDAIRASATPRNDVAERPALTLTPPPNRGFRQLQGPEFLALGLIVVGTAILFSYGWRVQ